MDVLEAQIKEFWKLSEGEENHFNFKLFIDTFLPILENKLARHGQLSYSKYLEAILPLYDTDILNQFVYISEHTGANWSYGSIIDLIFMPRYEHFSLTFRGDSSYINLLRLYNKLKLLIYENGIFLVDECIHAIHHSGFLIEIERLRNEYET